MATKNLESALADINKKFGKGSIMVLGDKPPVTDQMISTGSLLIDKILGGGFAMGRIAEIYGPESCGKTTLCLQTVASAQKAGYKVAYIDSEHAMDPKYAKKLGVKVEELLFSQPTTGEEALEIAQILAESGDVQLIVVDSVAALTPQAELDGEIGDQNIGLLARLMSKSMRMLNGTLSNNNVCMIFINQLRDKVNTGFSMGPNETTTGGRALKFYASQRVDMRKTTAMKEGDKVVGNNTKIKIVKNKIVPPMQTANVQLVFGKGFDAENEVLELAVEYGICSKAGAWFTAHDGNRAQGKAGLAAYYDSNPEAKAKLRELVVAKIKDIDIEQDFEINPETGEVIED